MFYQIVTFRFLVGIARRIAVKGFDERMKDLHFCNRRIAHMGLEFGKGLECLRRDVLSFRHPAATLSQETDEKRATIVDAVQASIHHVAVVRGVLFRHAPAQVDVHQTQLAPFAPFP